MQEKCDIASWSPTGVVEALVVDDHAIARTRSLNAEPKYGGAFHFDAIEFRIGLGLVFCGVGVKGLDPSEYASLYMLDGGEGVLWSAPLLLVRCCDKSANEGNRGEASVAAE